MKQRGILVLILLNAMLVLALAWMWVDTSGRLRNVHWQAPAPVQPDFSQVLSMSSRRNAGDMQQFIATLDRPLFAPNRRPPPKGAAEGVPDPLANIQLLGVFVSGDAGGIIAKVDGKNRRVRINETVGPWTLKSIQDREVSFARDGETRVLRLAPARGASLLTQPAP